MSEPRERHRGKKRARQARPISSNATPSRPCPTPVAVLFGDDQASPALLDQLYSRRRQSRAVLFNHLAPQRWAGTPARRSSRAELLKLVSESR